MSYVIEFLFPSSLDWRFSPPTLVPSVSYRSFHAPLTCNRMHLLGAMHACLNAHEIVRLIAHELITSKAKATTAALSCCCKSFEDPALDALWNTQEELFPLLGTLPRDVWNHQDTVSTSMIHARLPSNIWFESI